MKTLAACLDPASAGFVRFTSRHASEEKKEVLAAGALGMKSSVDVDGAGGVLRCKVIDLGADGISPIHDDADITILGDSFVRDSAVGVLNNGQLFLEVT